MWGVKECHFEGRAVAALVPRPCRLGAIVDATGAASYHGFLPVLVRSCIQSLTGACARPGWSGSLSSSGALRFLTALLQPTGVCTRASGCSSRLASPALLNTQPGVTFTTFAVRLEPLCNLQTPALRGVLESPHLAKIFIFQNCHFRYVELLFSHSAQEYVVEPQHQFIARTPSRRENSIFLTSRRSG